jgi:hypothetical protein
MAGSVAVQLVSWLFFTVLAGLLPPLLSTVSRWMFKGQTLAIAWSEALSGGELFIVNTILALAALGELLKLTISGARRALTVLFAALCLIVILVCLAIYQEMHAAIDSPPARSVVNVSMQAYWCTVGIVLGSVVFAEVAREKKRASHG